MSSDPSIDSMAPEERSRVRKQLSEQAVKLAVSSRWEDALQVNRELVRLFGEDADALNRLAKALSEVGQVTEARQTYSRAIKIDPTNSIARRNLDRLAGRKDAVSAAQPPSQLDTRLFVEEAGKATVATLQAVNAARTVMLDSGDVVNLQVQGNAVNVVSTSGEYIGMVAPRIGLRLSKMMRAGSVYSAALVTSTGNIKVMLRETFQHPSQIGRVSFPQSRQTDVRAYTRRGLLRGEEMDSFSDDDEVVDDDGDDWTETSDEGDGRHVGGDTDDGDDEGFD